MQNPIQKFRQSSVFEKPGILSDYLKTWTSSNFRAQQSSIFCAETLHTFPTCQYLQMGVWGFYFVQIFSYLLKLKSPSLYSLVFYIFTIGALAGLRQFLATESPLKMMKNALDFLEKALYILKVSKACVRYFLSNFYFFTK